MPCLLVAGAARWPASPLTAVSSLHNRLILAISRLCLPGAGAAASIWLSIIAAIILAAVIARRSPPLLGFGIILRRHWPVSSRQSGADAILHRAPRIGAAYLPENKHNRDTGLIGGAIADGAPSLPLSIALLRRRRPTGLPVTAAHDHIDAANAMMLSTWRRRFRWRPGDARLRLLASAGARATLALALHCTPWGDADDAAVGALAIFHCSAPHFVWQGPCC